MPQQQRVHQRIAELADPHLQRAAVPHQALAYRPMAWSALPSGGLGGAKRS